MSDFNDNPFARDTQVSIFTNNISIRDWLSKNCKKCVKSSECDIYKVIKKDEIEVTRNDDIPYDYVYEYFTLPLHLAKRMGINYTNPLYQIGEAKEVCVEFDSGEFPF